MNGRWEEGRSCIIGRTAVGVAVGAAVGACFELHLIVSFRIERCNISGML